MNWYIDCSYTPGVSALAFNPEGDHLAIAFSYTFEQGPLTTYSYIR